MVINQVQVRMQRTMDFYTIGMRQRVYQQVEVQLIRISAQQAGTFQLILIGIN